MAIQPWQKVITPRKEVSEGRSFNPDEFAIHLEQVVSSKAPEDYRDPVKFFSRTCFTRALSEHTGMVLRRLAGETANTAPVLTLVTQFGGGKTHTLTALYHLTKHPTVSASASGIPDLLRNANLYAIPTARVAVFVGNAWDPQPGDENPWLDIARQLAGEEGVACLGKAALTSPPGTEALARLFEAAGGSVLILFDEVLNFVNRYRNQADSFYAFLQNMTVAMTGAPRSAAVISLPRSQTEMTEWDMQWQERITKVVRRVAKDLIANDEAEISEVVRRRLFEELGPVQTRRLVAKAYADWCFERRNQLPPEWTSVDTAVSEASAREYLQNRFEACYPFHPATLSVFQRKWQSLSQYQQTRGTLAMLAQWVSWAYKDAYTNARTDALITLGHAPLEIADFRAVVLGQLGESRLSVAIENDISGQQSHARALDADAKGPLRNIHRRVGATILFESSGGQADKSAHLPELRFALGEPRLDTTSIDNAAFALETRAFYIRKAGTDGYRIWHQPTLKKVMNDRRAALDAENEVKPAVRSLVKSEFERGKTLPIVPFPAESADIPDSPRLTLVVMDPDIEWGGNGNLRQRIAEWTRQRSKDARLYPGALVFCIKKPGRELRRKVEDWLAWKRVKKDKEEGILGKEIDPSELAELETDFKDAAADAADEVWAGYRYLVLLDAQEKDGLRVIDLGQGHAHASETLCSRIISALKAESLLNESIGAGYLDRNWPPALQESGAWPLASLRKSFLDGSLTRLLDPDAILRAKILEFVQSSEFGLASVLKPDGSYERIWFGEMVASEEVAFEAGVFLLRKFKAAELKMKAERAKSAQEPEPSPQLPLAPEVIGGPEVRVVPVEQPTAGVQEITLRLVGEIPSEMWNRLGTKIIPKLKSAKDLHIDIEFSVKVNSDALPGLKVELGQILGDLGVEREVRIIVE